tara:strand:+ start:1561 stop:4566 length:3006 start_codon:yes stop_codon:yes gene_type:complete
MSDRIILERYQVIRELGSGGMGTVFLAHDTKLQRDVAIKVLKDSALEEQASIDRFKREVKAIASLSHPNVISLHDFAEEDGHFYAVMEYVNGTTLDSHLDSNSMSRSDAVSVAIGMANGLTAAHQSGIVHRDIKPSNVMLTSDNLVKILDFGLATNRKALELSEETMSASDLQTQIGTIMGTVGYMSPEQVKGHSADKRSDIFSFGAVLYEMLTGQRAFKRDSTIETMSAILNDAVPSLDLKQLPTTDPLFDITKRCLSKDAEDRFQDAQDLIQELNRVAPDTTQPASPSVPKRRIPLAITLCLLLVGGLLFYSFSGGPPERPEHSNGADGDVQTAGDAEIISQDNSPQVLFPKMLTLINDGKFIQAYDIGIIIHDEFKNDSVFQSAWQQIAPKFTLTSDPPGATVYYGDFGDDPATFKELGNTPLNEIRLSTSIKHFIFKLDGHTDAVAVSDNNFFTQITTINRRLFAAEDVEEGMIHITEGRGFKLTGMVFDTSIADGFAPTVPEFFIDKYEVTNSQFKAFVDAGGYKNPKYWNTPIVKDGDELSFEAATELLKDSTGRFGPSGWSVGRFPAGQADFPVQGVSWYEASAYAKWAGKSLPTLYHFSRANATDFGSEYVGKLIQLSNIHKGSYNAVGKNAGISRFGVFDLCGNVSEWVINAVDDQKLSLGGSTEDQEYFFNQANPVDPWDRSAKRGFRCIKYLTAESAELLTDIELQSRDYSDAPPLSDEIFNVYQNQFDYDQLPLEDAVIYSNDEISPDFTLERVEFNTVYGGERMIAYIALPRIASPPYQSCIFFHGAGAINSVASNDIIPNVVDSFKFIPQSGRALVIPVLKGQWDRNDGLQTWASNDSQQYADYLIKWTKDFRRTIDYLESRDDMDQDKVAYMGASWGAFNYLITAAIEPRIKMGICYVGGLSMTPARAEVDQISYVHRVKQPTLWLVGKYDQIFPLMQSAQPAFDFLGTPNSDKRIVVYPTEHSLPINERIHETLDWLDKYFGAAQ